jgi:phosphoribosylanthranilate isomerase
MWVKICGNTNLEDAALAAELGADAVGFVFAPSKRQVGVAEVAAITLHLPQTVERVGVFDSHSAEHIAGAALAAGLTTVQLHGGMDEALVDALANRFAGRVRIIQTLHWAVDAPAPGTGPAAIAPQTTPDLLAAQFERIVTLGFADRVLIDSKLGAALGGTGVSFDWAAARRIFATAPTTVKLIVAGGLTPENVAEAIAQLIPSGVDVSSGVEQSPRRKDPNRLKRFIQNAHGIKTP